MIPVLYEAGTTVFTTNGLGRLSDATSCIVTEELNGTYELELTYPIDGIHVKEIREDRIIYAAPSEDANYQPFRIYKISTPLVGEINVYAEHISYLLSRIPVMPFTATSCSNAISKIKVNSSFDHPFTFWTDVSKSGAFEVVDPTSIRAVIGGDNSSILSTYGTGDLEFDGFTVKLHANRGVNRGVSIRYGKNLTDLKDELDISEIYTGIVPYWKKKESVTDHVDENHSEDYIVMVTLPEKVLWTTDEVSNTIKHAIPVDFSSDFEEQPSVSALRSAAREYLNANRGWEFQQNITVSFIALWQTEEYKDIAPLEKVKLCDTVNVVYPKMDINISMRVIKTEYNVLLDRYNSIEIGDAKSNLTRSIRTASNTDSLAASVAELDNRVSQISGGGGGGTGRLGVAFDQGAIIFSNGT